MASSSNMIMRGSCVLKVFRPTWNVATTFIRSFHCTSIYRTFNFHPCPPELRKEGQVKPVVVLFGWLLAKSRHLDKYGSLYHQYGADVFTVNLEVKEVLRPKMAEATARTILEKLISPEMNQRPILIHGFSVGGYLYAQVLHQMETDSTYSSVKDRILGQVLDSPVAFCGIPHGISNSATENPVFRFLMKSSIQSYLNVTAKYTTKVYLERERLFHNNPVRTPSLFLYSKDDKIADVAVCENAIHVWRDHLGMEVTSVCWDSSPHVSHFYVHTKEYVNAVSTFVERVLRPSARLS